MLDAFIKDKQFFEIFINKIERPIIYLSSKGFIEIANDFAKNILRFDSNQYVGINFKEFCLKHNHSLHKLFDNKKKLSNSIEESYHIDDKNFHILWKSSFLDNSENSFGGILLIGYDVTQYNSISDELHKKIFFYENILSKLPTNVYWKDRNCVYLGCNDRLANVMGLPSRDAVKGMTDFDFLWGKENAKNFIEFDKKVMQSGVPLTTEDVFEEANGKVVTVLTNKTPLKNESGDTIGVLAISVDITELKQTQMKLEIERQKSEAASRSKSEFIANMSHDLRTPITGMLAMIQDMLNTADQAKPSSDNIKLPQNSTALQNIVETVQRDGQYLMGATDELLQLCNEILEVVRLESGKSANHLESFNLKEVIEHNVELLQPTAHHKKLQLSYDINPDVPTYLNGSRLYLDRILLNLMSNALKFTEEGAVKVLIKVLDENHATHKVGENIHLEIQVEDTGIGIPNDKFDTIFENFSRLTASYDGLYKGAGLGLYTVKRYIEAMNGNIEVNSELGKGSCFTIRLPFTISDHSDRVKQSARYLKPTKPFTPFTDKKTFDSQESVAAQDATASILVVEDNPLAAIAAKLALKPFNCHIDIAKNGEEAVTMAEKRHYDLVLMDIGLPDFSGIEATKKIRSFSDISKSQVPIVALTGHANNPEMRQDVLDAGMQEVLSKPAQPLALESVLQNYVFKVETKKQSEHQQSIPTDETSESLVVIDWDASVRMCSNDPKFTRKMLSMMDDDLTNVKVVLSEAYAKSDTKALREELHRARGGVCYLKLPELEQTLKVFHEAVKAVPQNPDHLEKTYRALQQAIDNFKATWAKDFK